APAPPAPSAPAQAASAGASAVMHPLGPPVADTTPLAAADIGTAIGDLVGSKALQSFFRVDDFAHRFVATVDNMGRSHATALMWPVNPTAGRFTVEQRGDDTVIAADNGLRYTPFVLLAETVNTGRAVDLYVRVYPLLQQAYEELGYPKRYFNDRLIE